MTKELPSQKPVVFLGSSLKDVRGFPKGIREDCGYQLRKLQQGGHPDDFKPMPSIGKGVEELRIREEDGAFRIIYTARIGKAVYVLHVFQKKTQQTSRRDVDLARSRFKALLNQLAAEVKQQKDTP